MKVKIERRGGYAGAPAVGERNAGELDASQQKALEDLLASVPASTPSPGADRFHYKVEVTDEQGTRKLDVSEDAMPDVLASIPKVKL